MFAPRCADTTPLRLCQSHRRLVLMNPRGEAAPLPLAPAFPQRTTDSHLMDVKNERWGKSGSSTRSRGKAAQG